MSCCDLTLTVQEEDPITLEIVEAAIKPEQDKTVTPTYSEQTVLPDAGMTLGSVTVEPIPDPTDRMTITENGSYDVARIGTADVDVLPTLQTKTVEPKEYGQTIRADSFYDGLEQVNVLRIPEWYVVPQGSVEVTANGSYDVTEKKTVNVTVPVPVMPEEYAVGGSVVDKTVVRYYLRDGITIIYNVGLTNQPLLEYVRVPDTVKTIKQSAFSGNPKMDITDMPSALETIEAYAFFGDVGLKTIRFYSTPTITATSFWGCSHITDIFCPWSEGEVANAPWGATNATIHYNWEG